MSNHLSAVPDCLKQQAQWLIWKKEPKANGEGFTKIPYDAKRPTYKAASNKPETWAAFVTASDAVSEGQADGIGFAFAEGDSLVGIDLDHVLDSETGKLNPAAQEIVEQFSGRAYIERSPSGDGIHIWCHGKALRTGKGTTEKWCEVYDATSPRYFTVTGERFCDGDIGDCQDALDWLYVRHFQPVLSVSRSSTGSFEKFASHTDSDEEKLREALNHLPADDYEDWFKVGMALKGAGYGFHIWDEWSQKSPKYSERGMEAKWNSFRTSGLGLGSIFYWAQQSGWQPARSLKVQEKLQAISEDAWAEPERIINALLPVEPLAPELVPEPLRAYVFDEAERMSCPPDNVFTPLLVALGAVIGTACGIRPKAYDPWLVVPNIWGSVIAPPGRKKTSALKAGTRFLDELEQASESKFSEAERQYKADYAEFKATENRINADMKTAAKPGKSRYAGNGLRGGIE